MKLTGLLRRARYALAGLDARLSSRRVLLGALLSVLMAAVFAALSVGHGPLSNLNDIGSFRLRAAFIALAAAVYMLALLSLTLVHRGGFFRLLLRMAIVTAGMMILLTGINQKTHAFVKELLPLLRALEADGLQALAQAGTHLSAPAATVLYLISFSPVYEMYILKLIAIGCYLVLSLLMLAWAQERGLGWREDVLLALSMILPQAFMNAACTTQTDLWCLAPLALSLFAVRRRGGCPRARMASAILFGFAAAMSSLALWTLPLFIRREGRQGFALREWLAAALVPLALCVPAVVSGVSAGDALLSLLGGSFSLPVYASGAPHALSFLPRAAVEEMPEYFMLSQVPHIDTVTNAQPYYTQAHFEQAALGLTAMLQAAYAALCVWLSRREMDGDAKALALVLGALLVCPGAGSSAWLAADLLCLMLILAAPRLRLPACLVLFATAGAAAYPMLGETLLDMMPAFVLILTALLMALGIVPVSLSSEENHG